MDFCSFSRDSDSRPSDLTALDSSLPSSSSTSVWMEIFSTKLFNSSIISLSGHRTLLLRAGNFVHNCAMISFVDGATPLCTVIAKALLSSIICEHFSPIASYIIIMASFIHRLPGSTSFLLSLLLLRGPAFLSFIIFEFQRRLPLLYHRKMLP